VRKALYVRPATVVHGRTEETREEEEITDDASSAEGSSRELHSSSSLGRRTTGGTAERIAHCPGVLHTDGLAWALVVDWICAAIRLGISTM
jgi:hypothetical protein